MGPLPQRKHSLIMLQVLFLASLAAAVPAPEADPLLYYGKREADPQVLVGAVPAVLPYHNCVNKVTEVCYPVQKVEPTTITEQSCLIKGEVECTEVVVATIPKVTCSHAEHTKPAGEAVETE